MNTTRRSGLIHWWRVNRGRIAAGLLLAPVITSCSGSPIPDEDTGQVRVNVTAVPAGVHCLRIASHGSRSVTRDFTLTPGQDATVEISGLPLGHVAMQGQAFTSECTALSAQAVPAWISDAVDVELQSGSVANVALVLRRNGRARVSVDFEAENNGGMGPGGSGGASGGGSGGTSNGGSGNGGSGNGGSGAQPPQGDDLTASQHVALGVPVDADPADDFLINRQQWVASYNNSRRVSNWVAWRVSPTDLGTAQRQDDFRADLALPAEFHKVTPLDYRNSGYDRGHLCPSADRTSSVQANSATFLMTNMHPQLAALNQRVWEAFESFTRTLVRQDKDVYVVAGAVFDPPSTSRTIGQGVHVPAAEWKVIVVLERGQTVADITPETTLYAVEMPNTSAVTGTDWKPYAVAVDALERSSGYDVLRDVRDDVEALIETKTALP